MELHCGHPHTLGELSVILVGALVFILLIGLDIGRALKKGAHWVPGHAVVLSALTIELMGFVESQSSSIEGLIHPNDHESKQGDAPAPMNDRASLFVIIHASRVMLCLLIALFLPGMARPGYEEKWITIAALGFSVFLDILSGFLLVHFDSCGSRFRLFFFYSWDDNPAFIVSGVIITLSLVWLVQLLICSIIASKSIRIITGERIPLILEHPAENTWKAVEDQVLKSWIVFLACNPESRIARSVLASSAALAVTFCIVSSLVGWVGIGMIGGGFGGGSPLRSVITVLELIFILIGWAVISWRYFTSVAYYSTRKTDSWSQYFHVERFWTCHIENLLQEKKEPQSSQEQEINRIIATEETEIPLRKQFFMCILCLQRFVVVSSKGYWLLSKHTFCNKLIRNIASSIFSNHIKKVDEGLKEYKAILESLHIVGETPRSVFVTHRKFIERAKNLQEVGYTDAGKACENLIKFLTSSERVGIQCLDPGNNQTGLNFLCKLGPGPGPTLGVENTLGVEKYFMYMKKRSWKLTAVSLINIILRLSPDSGKSALNAYSEAMELMGLVENSDPETDRLLSKAADRLFKTLQSSENAPGEGFTEIKKLAEQIKKEAVDWENIQERKKEAVDWENIAAKNALYKLCMSIDCRPDRDFGELISELERSVADIIGDCIKKVGVALVGNCIKWAKDFEEKKLLEAVYIAGKSRGLMELLKWDPNLQIAPTTEETAGKVQESVEKVDVTVIDS